MKSRMEYVLRLIGGATRQDHTTSPTVRRGTAVVTISRTMRLSIRCHISAGMVNGLVKGSIESGSVVLRPSLGVHLVTVRERRHGDLSD
jgi:hypothetical protein